MNHLKMFESFNDEDSLMNNIRDVLLELNDINFKTSVVKKLDSLERITINIAKSGNKKGDFFSLDDISEYLKRINELIISENCVIKNIYIQLSDGKSRFINISRVEEFPEWEVVFISLQFIPN